jgi:hypothetical protein
VVDSVLQKGTKPAYPYPEMPYRSQRIRCHHSVFSLIISWSFFWLGLKVVLPEGVELWVRLLLRDGERIKSLLLAVVVLDEREVVPLHPEIALVPAGLFYGLHHLAFQLLKTAT